MAVPGIRDVSAGTARFGLAVGVSVVAGVLVAGLVMPLVAGAGVLAKTASQDFENLPSVLVQPLLPQQTKIVAADGKTVLATIYSQNRTYVGLSAISPLLQKAVVAIEDSRFYEHNGVDLRGLARALVSNAQGGAVQGGSTLTQQYVKNVLVLTATNDQDRADATARTPARKLREMRLALGLEKVWSKDQILQGYLNIAYFGDGAYGAEAAAERYFGVHAALLTLPQAATLAGVVQSPVSYDPITNPTLSQTRRNVVLERMSQLGVISDADYVKAAATPIKSTLHPKPPPSGCSQSIAPYFCNYVLKYIKSSPFFGKTATDRADFLAHGYTIRTTLDVKAQQSAQQTLDAQVPITDKHGAAVSVVQPGTGNILVMAQNRIWGIGKGNQYTTYNYNVDRRTQPDGTGQQISYNGVGFQTGSTFKIFVLAAALEQHIPVNTRIHAPVSYIPNKGFKDCEGHDASANTPIFNDEGGSGTYDLRTGTWQSVNTFFVQLELRTGLCAPAKIAQSMGVVRADGGKFSVTPSMTLGANPVAPLHMAEAYATFAAHGNHCTPRSILSITTQAGKSVAVPPPACKQVIDPSIADGVTAIMKGVIDFGTGKNEKLGRPAAGKTGTTDEHVNVWFCGYIPQLAAAVWVGDPTGAGVGKKWWMWHVKIGKTTYSPAFGYNLPGPVWKDVMSYMSRDLPVQQFGKIDPSVIKGFTTKVPDVKGMTAAKALQALADAGFTPALAPKPIDSLLPAGIVVRTNPRAGSSVGTGSTITVYVSSGKPPPGPSTSPSPTATTTPPPGGGGGGGAGGGPGGGGTGG
jgi:membrane peptidoglycan carboxypeptidase